MSDTPPLPGGRGSFRSARERANFIHAEIRNRICFLDYAPGRRLSEEALAEEFGISRTPLRRVLARLEDEGLVQSVHGVGTLVTDVDIRELEQVYRLRMELAELLGVLDPVAPDADLLGVFHDLRDEFKRLRASITPGDFARINRAFFHALLRLTANRPLREISERLYYRTARIWMRSIFASKIDLQQETATFERELEDIVAALRIGDLTAVGHLRRAHVSMSFARLRRATRQPE